MLAIGLTGGIGSGKSAVTRLFRELDVPVLDADEVAREVVAPGEPALQRIRERFGPAILQSDGSLDRQQLRALIFDDPDARLALESLLHPAIRRRMRSRLAELQAAYAICAIPLLVETGQANDFDRVLVIDCPEEVQIQRVTARDQVDREQVRAILAAQADRATRLAVADDVIDNAGPVEALPPQVERLHQRYLELASSTAALHRTETSAGSGGTPSTRT